MKTEWNIEGIADEVMAAMKADDADIGYVNDYVRRIAYWPVFSRATEDAALVAAQVKVMVVEKWGR